MTTMQALRQPAPAFERLASFWAETRFAGIPPAVADFAALLILDLIGVAAAATRMQAGLIARNHAVMHWAAGPGAPNARLLFDGRRTSLPGAAFALATQLDNLDAHDGWQPSKGHAGAALFPTLAALADARGDVSGQEAIVAMILGYEIAYRASAALHATTADYHTSGAWNALGCATITARLRGMTRDQLRHALGIAEFHAPRSQMMREIANPTMLHDGTSWGAPTGIASALMAEAGFTGAPAALVEFDDAAGIWADLGQRWLTTEQYIKNYPVCRWAHAPIDAALALRARHDIKPARVERVEISTFKYSAQLWNDIPTSSPVAQYALAWPVAAAIARGRVTVDEVLEASFSDAEIGGLVKATQVTVDDKLEAAYPAQRLGRVVITLKTGERFDSGVHEASGGPVPAPTRAQVVAKYRAFATPVLGETRTRRIEETVLALSSPGARFTDLLDLITPPVDCAP
ncbi:MAG: MmgE/PrpD family protein [Hyphomicrobiaceae bacterium]